MTTTTEFTETDKSFDRAKPGYYIFEKEMVKPWDKDEGRCLSCNKVFRTHLLLCRFCSRECQVETLKRLSTLAHAPEPRPLEERVKTPPPTMTLPEVITMVKKEGLDITTGSEIDAKAEARKKYRREWMAKKRAEKKTQDK